MSGTEQGCAVEIFALIAKNGTTIIEIKRGAPLLDFRLIVG